MKVEYHANENLLKHSEKIVYVCQRLMHPIIIIIINLTMLVCKKKNAITFLGFYNKNYDDKMSHFVYFLPS